MYSVDILNFMHVAYCTICCTPRQQALGGRPPRYAPLRPATEARSGSLEPLLKYLTLKALRYGSHVSVICKLHRTCLYLVSIHQMAHPRLRLRTS